MLRILFLLLLSTAAAAQFPVSPNAYDDKGLRTGHWTVLYDSAWKETSIADSAIHYRLVRFESGKPSGKVRDFYRNGTRQWEGELISVNPDVQHGIITYFFENGKPRYNYEARDGKMNGFFKEYSTRGILLQEGYMKNDSMTGTWIIYNSDGIKSMVLEKKRNLNNGTVVSLFPDGSIEKRGYKIDDLTEGLWEEYYPNGKLKSREHFHLGKYHGPGKTYYENGQLESEGQYMNDLPSGVWHVYHENGQLNRTGSYDSAGLRTGLWKHFHANGKPYLTAWRKAGKLHGSYEEFYEDGSPKKRGYCEEDQWSGPYEFFLPTGVVERRGTYVADSLHGHWTFYFESGKLQSEGNYDNGAKDGEWKYYFENGALSTVESFRKGVLHGLYVDYYENGKVSERVNYVNGKQDGVYEKFYEQGERKTVGLKVQGMKHGDWYWYFPDGQLDSHEHFDSGRWEGPWQRYYSNGKKRSEGSAKDDLEHGWKKIYFRNGQLNGEGLVEKAKREGKWTYYDSISGKIQILGAYYHDKPDGLWRWPLAKSRLDSYGVYNKGFQETFGNIEDSLKRLADEHYTDQLMPTWLWLNKVRKRDFGNEPYHKAKMVFWSAYIESSNGRYKEAEKSYLDYIEKIRVLKGDTSYQYATAVNNLAVVYADQKKYSTSYELLRGLSKGYASQKEETQNEITHHENLAMALGRMSGVRAQISYMEDLVQRRKGNPRAKNEYTLEILNDLGNLYMSDSLNYERAEGHLRNVMRLADSAGLKGYYEYALAHYRMATLRRAQANRKDALAWAKKAMVLQEPYFKSHPGQVSDTYDIIGNLYMGLQYPDSSFMTYSTLRDRLTEIGWQRTPDYASALDGLGEVYYVKYEYEQALRLWTEAREILESIRATQRIEYVDVLQALAMVVQKVDDKREREAEEYLLRAVALEMSVRGKNWKYRTMSLSLAEFYTSRGKYEDARRVLEQLLPEISEANGTAGLEYAVALEAMAENEYESIHYQKSIDIHLKALAILEQFQTSYPLNYIKCLSQLGWANIRLVRYVESESYMRKAVTAARELIGPDSQVTITALDDLSAVLRYAELYSEAEKTAREMLVVTRKNMGERNLKYAYGLHTLAMILRDAGNLKGAIEQYQRYLKLVEEIKGRVSVDYADGLGAIAAIQQRLGNIKEAERAYLESVDIARAVVDNKTLQFGFYLRDIGNFYLREGMYSSAESYLSTYVELARLEFGSESPQYANAIGIFAELKGNTDRFQEAEEMYLQSVAIHKRYIGDRFGNYIRAAERLQKFYYLFGRNQEALDQVNALLPLVAEKWGKGSDYIDDVLFKSGILLSMEQYDSARATAALALRMAEVLYARGDYHILDAHNLMGIADIRQLRLDSAEYHFNYCIEQRKLAGAEKFTPYAASLNNLGTVFMERGDYAKAEQLYKQSGRINEANGYREGMNNNDLNLGKLYNAMNRVDLAESFFHQAVDARRKVILHNFYFLSDREKAAFWKSNRHFIEYYQSFAVQRGKQKPALLADLYNLQLSTKGLLLNSSNKIKKRILSSRDSLMVNEYFGWLRQRDALAQLYSLGKEEQQKRKAELDSLERAARATEKNLNITAEDLEKDRGRETTWRDVQRALAPNEAAIEVVRVRHHSTHRTDSVLYVALVLTADKRDGPAAVVFANGARLEGRGLRYYRNAVQAQLVDTMSYSLFWKDVEPLLKGKRRLFISLDGVYNSVNLNTLRLPDGSFFVDRWQVTLVSSTRDVPLLKRGSGVHTRNNAALMGFPRYFLGKDKLRSRITTERSVDLNLLPDEDRSGVAPLPGTREEITKVGSILSSHHWEVDTFIEDDATEEAVKEMRQPGVLHIATHGFFTEIHGEGVDPMLRAGLLFTGAANFLQDDLKPARDNGILTAYEAANLNLDNTDLVILSACETARGEIENGEGVYGLQRAFQTAGAKAILMSLWKVDDEATQELMSNFYQGWMKGYSKSDAFRSAQMVLRQKYPSPYYWGAFVLLGE
ncbi:MAG: CHAT domain-containing protein [Cyclobacteriaceae bacterium]